MSASKLKWIAQTLALAMISTISLTSHGSGSNYQVEKAGYINSPDGTVEALCQPGDEVVEGSCEGDYRGISPKSREVDYSLESEATANGYRCKPYFLRYDQVVMVIAEVTCRPKTKMALVE